MEDNVQKELDLVLKQDQYRTYIGDHISNVRLAWDNIKKSQTCMHVIDLHRKLVVNPQEELINNINIAAGAIPQNYMISHLIEIHDLSKYSDDEFEGYRQYFYPVDGEEKNENEMNKSFEHHYMNNPHHPEFWTNFKLQEYIPVNYIVEMACDWIAMSIFNGKQNALDWYNSSDKKKMLGKAQANLIEELLWTYYKEYNIDGTEK